MNSETRWSVNESLLQSYRSIFISSQSFLLAVGALTFDKESWMMTGLNIVLATMSLVMIRWIWFPVVKSRRRIVDYYKFSMDLPEEVQNEFFTAFKEDDFVKDGELRNRANEFLLKNHPQWTNIKSDLRETRKKVDGWIPLGFSIVWVIFLIISIIQLTQLIIN